MPKISPSPLLLDDDEAGIRTVLSITLTDMGYAVSTAQSTDDALLHMQLCPCPIVITDIKMPGRDGLTLLTEIKKHWPETEVIMLTGHGDMELAVRSLQLAAADFIAKPVSGVALEVALKRAEERIHMKQQLKEYTDQLEEKVAEKTQALIQSERMAAAGEAATTLAHSIKNIASGLEGCIFLLDQGLQQDRKEYVEQGWDMLKASVTRIRNLTQDLLTHARTTSLTRTYSCPAQVVRSVCAALLPPAQQHGVTVQTAVPDTIPSSDFDASAIERALLNIAHNALEATIGNKETGHISLSAAYRNTQLCFEVQDNGIGMSQETISKLFTPFFTTKGLEGTGLGLTSAQNVARLHGGDITIHSLPGAGTTVTLCIPVPKAHSTQ